MNNMKQLLKLTAFSLFVLLIQVKGYSQVDFEWRINNVIFNSTDPDGAGAATGSVTFTMQLHTRNIGAIIPITAMSTGFCWQTANAMLPTGVPCATSTLQTSNIVMGPSFSGYTFNTINHCSGIPNVISGGQTFDRRVVGTIEGGVDVPISNAWINVFTATLWTRNLTAPQGGFIVLNSTFMGNPGGFANYDISNAAADALDANSLTFSTPLGIGGVLPVTYTSLTAGCTDKGALVKWSTGTELNADYFELQRSKDGNEWSSVSKVKAKGNSTIETSYEQMDLLGGAALYRLKQFDFDGKFYYSTIIRTNCDDRNIEIVIYPVPARDVLNVVIKTAKAIKTQLEIYDAAGRLVKKVNVAILVGNNNLPINLAGLANGQYVIRSNDPTLQLNKKFTILH